MLKFDIYKKHVFAYGHAGLVLEDTMEFEFADEKKLQTVRFHSKLKNYVVKPLTDESHVALIDPEELFKLVDGANADVTRLEGVVSKLEDQIVDHVDEIEDLKQDLEALQDHNDSLELELEDSMEVAQENFMEYLANCDKDEFARFVADAINRRSS